MPAENIVEVHHLKKSVGQGEHELSILTGVELVVKRGETIALVGESGSGKSTLLAILAGLDDGSSGEVSLVGQPLHNMDEEARAKLRAKHVGFVFQSFMLIPTLNALETSSFRRCCAVRVAQKVVTGRKRWLRTVEAWVNVLIIFRHSFLAANSNEWRWREPLMVDLMCCLPTNPPVTLTARRAIKLPDLLFSLNREHGTTLIMVTHDLQLAARCDRCLRLVNGQLQEEA